MQKSQPNHKIPQSIGGIALSGLLAALSLATPSSAQSSGAIAPPLPTQNSPRTTVVDDGYTLGAGDRIKIDIFNVPEYSGENQVLADGTLNLALVGSVSVQGMTLKQASTDLASRYSQFLKRPIVTISVLTARPTKIAIAGEVNRPGSYTVETGIPTVTRMIQLAGGIKQSADVRQIQVRRPRARNNGTEQMLNVNLWQLLQTGDLSQDMLLRDGDTLFIPTLNSTDLAEATQIASSSFANTDSRPLKIAMVGEVARPGPYTIAVDPQNKVPTLTRAIQLAGGITQSADIRKIQVRRFTQDGQEKIVDVDLWKLLKEGDLRQDLPLQEGDSVVIPVATQLTPDEATSIAAASFSPDKITVNIVGEVVRPGPVQVQPNAPLNQALLAAGGFNNRAEQGSVQLVRLNPNGTVTQRDIGVNFAQGINDQNNPALRNNDTIVVGKTGIVSFGDQFGTLFGPIVSPITGIFGLFRLLGF